MGFAVSIDGIPADQVPPKHAVSTDVYYGRLHPLLVPFFEEQQVRAALGYTLQQWYGMAPRERALEIAISRLRARIDLQQSDVQQDKIIEQTKKAAKKGKRGRRR